MRRARGRLGLRRDVGGGHRGASRPQRSDRREGAALWRHHRALRRLALDSRHLAGTDWGIVESPDQAKTYLRHEAGNSFDAARVDAFLSTGPEAVDFFTSKTAVRFDMPLTFPDYHAEAPGGAQGGRSMVTRPFDGRELGEHVKTLGSPLPELTVFGMMLGSGKDIVHFMRATKSLTSAIYVAKRLSKHAMDVMRNGETVFVVSDRTAGRIVAQPGDGCN